MSQVFAVVWVRVRLLINTLRHKSSGWERVAMILTIAASLVLSLGIAVGLGFALKASTKGGRDLEDLHYGLLTCFWCSSFFGVLMPLLLSTGASGIDTARLKMFPLTRRKLALMSWGSALFGPDHLFYYPTLIVCFFVLWSTTGGLGLGQVLMYLLVPLIIVTWSSGLVALVQGILRHRRGKEIAGIVGVSLLVSVSMLPALFTQDLDDRDPEAREAAKDELGETFLPWLQWAQFTPPNLAADGIADIARGQSFPWRKSGGLLLWFGVGAMGAFWVFSRNLETTASGGQRRATANEEQTPTRGFDITERLRFLPPEVLAVMTKELRYLIRSTVGRFNLLMLPVLCAILSSLFKVQHEGVLIAGTSADQLSIYALLMYALLFNNNFVSNSAGWEGQGFKVYLLAPVPFQRVLFGKNLGVWLYSTLLFAEVILFWVFFRGLPSISVIASAALLYAGSMVLFTTVGNFSSILFPVPRDISSMKSQPSQASILISLLTVLALAGTCLFFVAIPVILRIEIGQLLPLAVYAAGSLALYRLSLPHAADLFMRKKENVLTRLEAGS